MFLPIWKYYRLLQDLHVYLVRWSCSTPAKDARSSEYKLAFLRVFFSSISEINSGMIAFLHGSLVASALAFLAAAHGPNLGKRAPLKAFGIEKNKEGFGSEPIANDDSVAIYAPLARESKKNETMPELKDRSLELLVNRQRCNARYGYCSGMCDAS